MAKKILIVDDEPANLSVLRYRLHAEGYRVSAADSGARALQKARKENPDLILLDVIMPEMNGFQVSKHLKENARTKHIPVILLTSLDNEEFVAKGLTDGAVCFISKPYNPVDLLEEIRSIVDGNRPSGLPIKLLPERLGNI